MSTIRSAATEPDRATDETTDLAREIRALIERARDAGYSEVGHFLAVAAEALELARAEETGADDDRMRFADDEDDDFLNAC